MKRTVLLTTIGAFCLIGNLAGASHAVLGVPSAPYGSVTRFFYSLQAPFQHYDLTTSVLSVEIESLTEIYVYPLSTIWPYSQPIQRRIAGFHSSYTEQHKQQLYNQLARYVFNQEQLNNPTITSVRIYTIQQSIKPKKEGSNTTKVQVAHYTPNV